MPARNFRPISHSKPHIFLSFSLAVGAALLLLVVSTASVKAAWEMYQTFEVAAEERAGSEAELAALRAEYEQMTATLNDFDSSRGLETAVRERFGVVKPGEGEIRIVRTEEREVVEKTPNPNPFVRLFEALFR